MLLLNFTLFIELQMCFLEMHQCFKHKNNFMHFGMISNHFEPQLSRAVACTEPMNERLLHMHDQDNMKQTLSRVQSNSLMFFFSFKINIFLTNNLLPSDGGNSRIHLNKCGAAVICVAQSVALFNSHYLIVCLQLLIN